MNLTIDELQIKWNNFSPLLDGFLLIAEHDLLSFHIGYSEQNKCLMIINTGKIEKNITSSDAIDASCVSLRNGEYALRFLLNSSSLDELFIKLCWDLIYIAQKNSDSVSAILDRFNKWMRLLKKKNYEILSSSAQKGLLGELLFLKELIKEKGDTIALNAWVGPEGCDQDFLLDSEWCEIKSTTIASTAVTISSLQQLDREDYGRLIVYFMDKTTANVTKTISLPEVVNEVKTCLSDHLLVDNFVCKLAMYGYYLKDTEHYKKYRYNCSSKREYRVADEFPKLTSRNVPVGIQSAHYDLNFLSIEQFKL